VRCASRSPTDETKHGRLSVLPLSNSLGTGLVRGPPLTCPCRAAGPSDTLASVSRMGPTHHLTTASRRVAGASVPMDVAQGGPSRFWGASSRLAGPRGRVCQLFGVATLDAGAAGNNRVGVAMPQWNPRPGLRWPGRSVERSSRHRAQAMHLQMVSARFTMPPSAIPAPAARCSCLEVVRAAAAIGAAVAWECPHRARRGRCRRAPGPIPTSTPALGAHSARATA